jgi:hypothetical protein
LHIQIFKAPAFRNCSYYKGGESPQKNAALVAGGVLCFVFCVLLLALLAVGGAAGCLALGLLPSVETGRQKYP